MSLEEPKTPEEIAMLMKERQSSDEKLLAEGAKDKDGRLNITEKQVEAAKKEMDKDLSDKEKEEERGAHESLEQNPDDTSKEVDKPKKIDAKKIAEEDSAKLAELRKELNRPEEHAEDFRRKVIQEWEVMCQEFLNQFWEKFSERSLDPIEKSQRFIFGKYQHIGNMNSIAIGNVEIHLNKQDSKLRDFYEKGITDVGTIFEQAPEIKAVFNQPQLWKEAERRVGEEQK